MSTVSWNIQARNQAGQPIDLGIGPIDFLATPNTNGEVIQNVRTILTTPIWSVPLYRDFGTDYSFLDYPMNVAINLIVAEVFKKVTKYEPRAQVLACTFSGDTTGTTGELVVTVVIRINLNALTSPSTVLAGAPGSLKTVIDTSSGAAIVQEDLVSS